jgi:hypothetical protein
VTDTTPATSSIPAGWYPNPENPAQQRWWDGAQWTEHVSPPAGGSPQPAAAYASQPAAAYASQAAPAYGSQAYAQLQAPAGTNWNTPWIWLVIALPMLGLIPLLFTDPASSSSVSYSTNPLLNGTDPVTTLINFALSVLIAGGVVTFAFLDHRELRKRGVPQPFHWAFAFFALIGLGVIYAIGRAVVVKKRTGNGGPVLAVAIASIVIAVIVFLVYFIVAFAQIMQNMPGVY